MAGTPKSISMVNRYYIYMALATGSRRSHVSWGYPKHGQALFAPGRVQGIGTGGSFHPQQRVIGAYRVGG